MGDAIGVLAAALNTTLGGLAVGVTRFVVGATDPITLAALRFGIGAVLLLPFALGQPERWPQRRDLPAVVGLGLVYFALYPVLFNAALASTTAVRGALALSTAPLLTMAAAAVLGVEPLTARKTLGVLVATAGVAAALTAGLAAAPAGAWRGDLLMVAAALCAALYSVWSRPLIGRSGTVPYTVSGMLLGAIVLATVSVAWGGAGSVAALDRTAWAAIAYLGALGSALAFYLWTFALERTTPTRVAITMTLNPIAAGLFGVVALDEPVTLELVAGLLMVLLGIGLAATGAPVAGAAARKPTGGTGAD